MKNAAKAVVNSLGVGDYFAVIEFDNFANVVGRYGNNGLMMRATDENKQFMSRYIDDLETALQSIKAQMARMEEACYNQSQLVEP